jgi:hypothetical protein
LSDIDVVGEVNLGFLTALVLRLRAECHSIVSIRIGLRAGI